VRRLKHILLTTLTLVSMLPSPSYSVSDAPTVAIVISDLHFGLGRLGDDWNPLEDFRWTNALRGFLAQLDHDYANGVDLVIAGDFLELWQHPAVPCLPKGECGCTVKQMEDVARTVTSAHSEDFAALAAWLNRRPTNHLTVIPGNHDAALMEPSVWKIVRDALSAPDDQVSLSATGTWVSADGTAVVEHGHQISFDVNSFPRWPAVTRSCDDQERMFRPWGELFVQSLYTEKECEFPIIDNLSSESEGARLYSNSQGTWRNAADVARFIAFNLFETSSRQKVQLGKPPGSGAWDESKARSRGYRLFAAAMDPNDPLRTSLLTGDKGSSPDLDPLDLRAQLDAIAHSLPREGIMALCDEAELRRPPGAASTAGCELELGKSLVNALLPLTVYLTPRLTELKHAYPSMALYVYGHTHRADYDITVEIKDEALSVVNSGAFQRLIDFPVLHRKASDAGISDVQALKTLKLEADLAPCYGVVEVKFIRKGPVAKLRQWFMAEDAATGQFLEACDRRCTSVPERCSR